MAGCPEHRGKYRRIQTQPLNLSHTFLAMRRARCGPACGYKPPDRQPAQLVFGVMHAIRPASSGQSNIVGDQAADPSSPARPDDPAGKPIARRGRVVTKYQDAVFGQSPDQGEGVVATAFIRHGNEKGVRPGYSEIEPGPDV